ncbi:MAG: aminopeptidase P family protein [Bosea sp.]|uniref:M24 family metallopeptidase n=1 Tax=Bosea sp. (in: a-proteobacteria) TaxID=1871050 RepID=UPI0023842E6B|nr:aminopeptidase P family protein [Bosea sp. (in: a-proteobacteria)]MCP4736094.1 aminopeptidase P family protein [Bosea sp. (in: a-proteobacteria)]
MSRHDFTAEEFAERRARVRRAMAGQELDWLVLFHPVSIRWLTGSDAKSYQEFQCLLVPAADGPITMMAREGERAEILDDALVDRLETFGGGENEDPIPRFAGIADELGLLAGRVGVEVPAYYLHPHHYSAIRELFGAAFVEASNLVHNLSLVKSPAELGYIRRAAAIADETFSVFGAALRPGRSELEVAGEVYGALLARGSGLAASPINLVSGERSCYSHGAPTERRLRAGDYGSVEYGATFRRYTATLGRQFCLGQPTARMRELYDIARRACDACIAEIRDGAPATAPHEAAKRVIGEAGLEQGRVHTSGYGLAPGFPPSWGEPMHMIGGSRYTLRAGMVVSVEPPVFLHEEGLGARIIDNVLVTQGGCELLSRSSRDLIVV